MTSPLPKIALLLPSLAAGGVGRVQLHLAGAFAAAGYPVDLVLCRAEGSYLAHVPEGVNIVTLEPASKLMVRLHLAKLESSALAALLRPVLLTRKPAPVQHYLPALACYLATIRPDALLAAKTHTNLLAIWAKRLSGVSTRVVVSEHSQLSHSIARSCKWRWRCVAPLVKHVYAYADEIVAVSKGVAEDLANTTGLAPSCITPIYNPVVTPQLTAYVNEPPFHPWLQNSDVPVIIAAGRLTPQKNFPLLLRAFAKVRAKQLVRLVIMGEGRERAMLEQLTAELGIVNDVSLPGFVENPYAAFAHASLFVLSSDYEGLPTVLIEAMACGCPVVATDCPSGPEEILERGQYGHLTPVNDADALAKAILTTLAAPLPAAQLIQRANEFSLERSVNKFLEILLPDQQSIHVDHGMTQ